MKNENEKKKKWKNTYSVHNQHRRHVDRHTLELVDNHQARVDLVHRERLQAVLQHREPLQPPDDGRYGVEVDEEACKRHLVQCGEGREEDGDPAIGEEGTEEEILHFFCVKVGWEEERGGAKRAHTNNVIESV